MYCATQRQTRPRFADRTYRRRAPGAATLPTVATPRYKLVDPEHPCAYHLASRCVRRAWLCGLDKRTGRDYSHRKRWLIERLLLLARCFAVEIYAYAVMSNHFHIVVHYDPKAYLAWSDEEVARRWVEAFPPKAQGANDAEKTQARSLLLGDPIRLARARLTLGSLSAFMKHLRKRGPLAIGPSRTIQSQLTYCFNTIYFLKYIHIAPRLTRRRYNNFATFRRRVAPGRHACSFLRLPAIACHTRRALASLGRDSMRLTTKRC